MRIGLISDTHGRLRPEVFTLFAGVEHILHAGDVGGSELLSELEALAPVTAVIGNTDGFPLVGRLPETAEIELAGRVVTLVHGHTLGSPDAEILRRAFPAAEIIVFGHTHRPLEARVGGALVVNPGAAGPARFNLKPSVAVLRLEAGSSVVEFHELGG